MTEAPIVAGVELGGTKLILVVARGREVLAQARIPTEAPDETLGRASAQLAAWRDQWPWEALGIASFGPIALDPARPDYGRILATPKPGWAGTDVVGGLAPGFSGPIGLQTDVTAAALAEREWGAAQGLHDLVYVTVGTGIGMGVIVNGEALVGSLHPEAGHLRVRRLPDDGFAGTCPFHRDCLEGLASGPAVAARAGRAADTLPSDDPAWAPVADALAEAFATLFLTLATPRIVVGGGIGVGQPQLLPEVRARVVAKLAGYLPFVDGHAIATRIVPAMLGGEAGPLGAALLAERALSAAAAGARTRE